MGAWVGWPPSSTRVHERETNTGWRKPERPCCDSGCHIHWASKQRSRISGPSTSSAGIPRRPKGRYGSCISHHFSHPLSVH